MLVDLFQKIKDWADARFLKLTGGTVTGGVRFKNDGIDQDGSAPSSDVWGQTMPVFVDKDGDTVAYIESSQATSGTISVALVATRKNASGEPVYNAIAARINQDYSLSYGVTSPAAFRTAIGAMGEKYANGYLGMTYSNGADSNWIRTTQSGIIPYQSGGHGSLGTSTWPFNNAYINAVYGKTYRGTTQSLSWVQAAKNIAAPFYAPKSAASGWCPTIQIDTPTGCRWSIGNYNNEYLKFAYVTKANMDSNTNGATEVNLRNASGTIALVPNQLYNNTSGTTGTVTLSASAANYNHMRIYFFGKSGSDGITRYECTEIYSPNGKIAQLSCSGLGKTNDTQVLIHTKTATISGTSITNTKYYAANVTSSGMCGAAANNEIYITRVEGWND